MVDVIGNITVILEGQDRSFEYEALGLTYDSSDEEVIEALNPVFAEEGINLKDEWENGGYMIKRSDNSHNIHLYPKSTAGEGNLVKELTSQILDTVDSYCNLDGAADGLNEAVENVINAFLEAHNLDKV